uniref:GOLD domain-containing protein n=1 Tax=Macrostomum lignano TaxID=282301 RepID=A0A1I8FKL4_9PLAT
ELIKCQYKINLSVGEYFIKLYFKSNTIQLYSTWLATRNNLIEFRNSSKASDHGQVSASVSEGLHSASVGLWNFSFNQFAVFESVYTGLSSSLFIEPIPSRGGVQGGGGGSSCRPCWQRGAPSSGPPDADAARSTSSAARRPSRPSSPARPCRAQSSSAAIASASSWLFSLAVGSGGGQGYAHSRSREQTATS